MTPPRGAKSKAPGPIPVGDELRRRRPQEVAFAIAKRVLERYYPDQPWLFPQLLRITRDWMDAWVTLKDNTFVQMLLLAQHAERASEHIQAAIVRADEGRRRLVARLAPYDRVGSTRAVDFDTSKRVMPTAPERCHVSDVVADSGWEHTVAERLEEMDKVRAYVKNDHLGFVIPYSFIPTGGSAGPAPPPRVHRVRALEERADREITFPRVTCHCSKDCS